MKGKKHLAGREETEAGPGNFSGRAVEEARQQGVEVESVSGAEQEKLLSDLDDNAPNPSIQGDKMLAKFVRPHFDMEEDDRIIELEFSIALSDAHRALVDSEILAGWEFIEKHNPKGVFGIDVPPQTIDLFLSPNEDAELHLTAAEVTQAKLSLVEKTGDGKTEKIMRLQFRLVTELMKNITTFATTQYGNAVWIRMGAAQGVLA